MTVSVTNMRAATGLMGAPRPVASAPAAAQTAAAPPVDTDAPGRRAAISEGVAQAGAGEEILRVGSKGPAVEALQARLAALRYAVNTDGKYTADTRNAVMAFQKINGLARDGAAGAQVMAALENPREPKLGPGKANRVDVDLSTQTLVVVRGGQVDYIVNATSGDPNHPDGRGIATPEGTFIVDRKIPGTREAKLGKLYYPSYFHHGVAVHGSNSIVAQPASHGCVRIPRSLEQRVYGDMPLKSQVVVHR